MELQANVRSAFILVNGIQLIQCRLPTVSEGSCTVYHSALENLRVGNDYGCLEINCVFYASSDVSHLTSAERPWIGELIIDDSESVYLGQLPGGDKESVSVSRFVATYPRTLELRIQHAQQDFYRHPEEDTLVEEIQLLLTDQRLFPGGGCVPHTNIQSRVENLEVYKRIIHDHYKGKWFTFLAHQKNTLHLLPQPGEETRIGLRQPDGQQPPAKAAAPVDSTAEEQALLQSVIGILEGGDHTYVELLRKLEQVSAFADRLNPSDRILFRFLQAHTDTFWVKYDPMHTTRVGLVR